MFNFAQQEGLEPELLQSFSPHLSELEGKSAVPADHFFALHEYLGQHLGPGFAVRIGQAMEIEDYGVLGLSWRTCSYAGEIFERSERYFKLLSDTYVFKLVEQESYTDILLQREAYRPGVAFSNEATLSASVVVLQAMTDTKIRPLKVFFKHKAPPNLEHHHRAFQGEVEFEAAHYGIRYLNSDLAIPTAKADANIHNFLLQRVAEEQEGVQISTSQLQEEVEELIRNALPSGIPSLSRISQQIGMSDRTLSRRLKETGFSFRELVQKTQSQLAQQLLLDPELHISQIAFSTGFSEQSAFNRAFKKWTGQAPSEYRNR